MISDRPTDSAAPGFELKLLPWDSDFFGARIATADLHQESIDVAVRDAMEQRVACLYVVAPGNRLPGIIDLAGRGARLVALRHTLTRQANTDSDARRPARGEDGVRLGKRTDARTLRKLAEELAPFSRFAVDPRFDRSRIAAMYRAWADQCLDGGIVTVTRDGTGFVGITLSPSQAHVALVYVNGASAGRGLGRALLDSALATADRPAVVATDAGNVPALRMYENAGFRSASMSAIFHLWLDELRGDRDLKENG